MIIDAQVVINTQLIIVYSAPRFWYPISTVHKYCTCIRLTRNKKCK